MFLTFRAGQMGFIKIFQWGTLGGLHGNITYNFAKCWMKKLDEFTTKNTEISKKILIVGRLFF